MTQLELAELVQEIWNDTIDRTDKWVMDQSELPEPVIINDSMYLRQFHSTLHSDIWSAHYTEEEKEILWHLARQMLAAAEDKNLPEA